MRIRNGLVLTDKWRFECRDVTISSGSITDISCCDDAANTETVLDAAGLYVLPGLIDSHIHACAGHDFCDLEKDSLRRMSELLVRYGVTSFSPASMAYDEERLESIFREAGRLIKSGIPGGSQIRGIHMEGPFFSKAKKGAQSERFLINPEIDFFDRLNEASGGNIRIVDIAAELPGAMDFNVTLLRRRLYRLRIPRPIMTPPRKRFGAALPRHTSFQCYAAVSASKPRRNRSGE
jgi:N-acetylglucosamine-6-phosphate deacetylase